jgi:hypothetical protein
MIIMARDERILRQPDCGDELACEQLGTPLCPQYEPSIYTTRGGVLLPWLRCSRFGTMGYLSILLMVFFAIPTSAVFIEFENCLSDTVQTATPLQLQFVPLFVDAKFNTTDPSNSLQVTVWGNVTGSGTDQRYLLPPPTDPYWSSNQTDQGGKIQDEPYPSSAAPKLTTLANKVAVLTYQAWSQSVDFCDSLINASCPLGPRFFANALVLCACPLF